MKKLLSEPLVHFCLIGACLYLVLLGLAPSQESNSRIIEINDEALNNYLQFQTKSFGGDQSALAKLNDTQRKRLTESFVRDEALYREALSLGLDNNDEILRRRLIQKMEYVAQGFVDELPAIDETRLQEHFESNIENYRQAAATSFTHVFLPNRETKQAEALLLSLNQQKVRFEDSGQHGQRYLYHRNYVDRSDDYIASHFGKEFQQTLFQLASSEHWQGPISSLQGLHLVMIKKMTASRLPALKEVAATVLGDVQRQQQQAMKGEAVAKIVNKYTVSQTQGTEKL
jgi:hypothetical protein